MSFFPIAAFDRFGRIDTSYLTQEKADALFYAYRRTMFQRLCLYAAILALYIIWTFFHIGLLFEYGITGIGIMLSMGLLFVAQIVVFTRKYNPFLSVMKSNFYSEKVTELCSESPSARAWRNNLRNSCQREPLVREVAFMKRLRKDDAKNGRLVKDNLDAHTYPRR